MKPISNPLQIFSFGLTLYPNFYRMYSKITLVFSGKRELDSINLFPRGKKCLVFGLLSHKIRTKLSLNIDCSLDQNNNLLFLNPS